MKTIIEYDIGSTIDETFKIVKWIGYGATSAVAKGLHINSEVFVAIKIYHNSILEKHLGELFNLEVENMKKLDNKNILHILAANKTGILIDNKHKKHSICYIVTELADNNSLDYYASNLRFVFSEMQARKIFKDIFNGIHYLHSSSIVHRDIKTNNILFDKFFDVKIGDFGFSKNIESNNSLLKTYVGTKGYQSPEVVNGKNYDGFSNDVFSLGVILFILINKNHPFLEARHDDKFYKYFYKKDYDGFWKIYENRRIKYSDSLKDLINGMLKVDNRFTMEDIKNHEWFNQNCESDEFHIKHMLEIKHDKQNCEEFFLMKKIENYSYKNESLEYRNLSFTQQEVCNSLFEKIGFTSSYQYINLETYIPKYSFLFETNDLKDVTKRIVSIIILTFGINSKFTFESNDFSFSFYVVLPLFRQENIVEDVNNLNNVRNNINTDLEDKDLEFYNEVKIDVELYLDSKKKSSIVVFNKSEVDTYSFNLFFELLMNTRDLLQ